MRKIALTIVIIFTIAAVLSILFFASNKTPQRRITLGMPPIVDESMDSLLQSLEKELEQHQPDAIASLLPGITTEELEQAEAVLGQSIHPEMQALYRWHNGLANNQELFPGFGFWSLNEAIQTNNDFGERGVYTFLPGEKSWLILFPDIAGDGYYYDPERIYETGGVFYNFREDGYYRYFPSIKNLLGAIVECYQSNVYLPNADPDFQAEEQIMNKYGIEYQE
jgi:hypothetical protein